MSYEREQKRCWLLLKVIVWTENTVVMALRCRHIMYCFKPSFYRTFSTLESKIPTKSLECLNHRGLLRVSGSDVSEFLQGLITNDMRHLEEGTKAIYTMFLNTKGRVLNDSVIYKTREENVFFIECDLSVLPDLQKHLKMYRVRRKIDIDNVSEKFKVWALYEKDNIFKGPVQDVSFNILSNTSSEEPSLRNIIVCKDPRLELLGIRLVSPSNENLTQVIENIDGPLCDTKNEITYKICRYKLGVSEGTEDLPPGKCFPLEANADYLHGVSFHKGCYIGQELTARTYHTGVVRKRLMPLIFDIVPKDGFKPDMEILAEDDNSKTPIGKLRSAERNFGLGLLRVAEALKSLTFQCHDGIGHTLRPNWWPQEAPKERAATTR